MRRSLVLALAAALSASHTANARPPNGLGVLRILGSRAAASLNPSHSTSTTLGALVAIPSGQTAASLGLFEIAPGIGRLRGTSESVLAFGAAHPDAHIEVSPPLRALLANAQFITRAIDARETRGATGAGAAVGIVDTGIDPTLPDFRDPLTNKTRIAWLLDLESQPIGIHPDLEAKFVGANGMGAVYNNDDLDLAMGEGNALPVDPNGHGSHVASIAAGNGGGTNFIGMAPSASLIIVRAADATGTFSNDSVLNGAAFVFDRADAMGMPIVANFSLGTDFGPHDGNSLWEQTLASFAGSDHPGHVVVAALGNNGSIASLPYEALIHQSVEVTGGRVSVPIQSGGASNGSVQVWVALRAGANMRVGLDGPDGTWVSPIADENEVGHDTSDYNSGVIYGSNVPNTQVPMNSHGAIVVWSGKWPAGTYAITLDGTGFADLYLASFGDAESTSPVTSFTAGVREATVGLPATSPGIIGVGCTIDSPSWRSAAGSGLAIGEPVVDAYGGLPLLDPSTGLPQMQPPSMGEICYFSAAGPTLTGLPKPDILAPGAVVVGAMSQQALPGTPTSIFNGAECPPSKGDTKCLQVDAYHAVALGTSMSSPMVAGVIALLMQQDATITEDLARALIQAGAHRVRGPSPFFDQTGPGELDAMGALDALAEMTSPDASLPDASKSWMTLSEDFALADGSTPLTVTLELRTTADKRATLFDSSRLAPIAVFADGEILPATIMRSAAPGLFTFTIAIPAGDANTSITLGATFDGAAIVTPATIPVALDEWTAGYPTYVRGGCTASRATSRDYIAPLAFLAMLIIRRRQRTRA